MLPRRRNVQPPFEVMRGIGSPPPPPVISKPPTPAPAPARPPEAGQADAAGGWAVARQPITLRIPQGYAILMGLGMLAILVLAYGAGFSQGRSAEQKNEKLRLDDNRGITAMTHRPAPSVVVQSTGDSSVPTPAVAAHPGQDTRQAGFNYFVLIHAGKDEADRLVDFLTKNGVEAVAVPTHNSALFQVVALQPFRKDQLGGEEIQTYRQNLLRLGRIWKEAPYHGGSDLSTLYLEVKH